MSALSNLLPLIILFGIVGGGAFVLYQISVWTNQMADRGKKHMEKKNMSFTKEGGLKVGVKDIGSEAYEDKTQNVLVNVWNNASFPNKKGTTSTAKPSTSRTNSSQSRPNTAGTTSGASASGAAANLSPPASRGGQQRSASPVPGAFD